MLAVSASDAAQGFLNVLTDPCLKDVGGLLLQLHQTETSDEPTQATLGIGLCKVVTPLKAVVYIKQNPIIGGALIAGFLGIFVAIGYRVGVNRTLARSKKG
jgi:hypothetical protein